MIPIARLLDLPKDTAEILEAAGIQYDVQLAQAEPETLRRRMEMAAWRRGKSWLLPDMSTLKGWISKATESAGPGALDDVMEAIPEAVLGDPSKPVAPGAWTPPSSRAMHDVSHATDIDLSKIPIAEAVPDESPPRIDPTKFATLEDYNEGRIAIQPLSRERLHAPEGDDTAPVEEALPNARRPKRIRSKGDEMSRWTVRGVVHPRPWYTRLAAIIAIVWRVALVTGVIVFTWLVTQVEDPTIYKQEAIAGLVALVILWIVSFSFSMGARCRICSCHLFYSRNCLKNRKAHHIFGFGYVMSAALHLLLCRWLRCMYCGTAIRMHAAERE
jgi:hypothetical protein